ncbi:MAG: DUF4296 domain-containing protein [Bernardetiaceae bacterium]|jgi:hypothetical protein|nr:DUF4296 domain-containing protein [Bernardetiaceae bacterium]
MKNRVWALLLSCLLACEQTEPERQPPAKLLPKAQVASIMAEAMVAEAVVSVSGLAFADALARYDRYERDIVRRHQTDTLAFRQSYYYYSRNADDMEQLVQAINDTLTARRARLMATLPPDSARTVPAVPPGQVDSAALRKILGK